MVHIHIHSHKLFKTLSEGIKQWGKFSEYQKRQVLVKAQVSLQVAESALIGICKNSLYLWPFSICFCCAGVQSLISATGGEAGQRASRESWLFSMQVFP